MILPTENQMHSEYIQLKHSLTKAIHKNPSRSKGCTLYFKCSDGFTQSGWQVAGCILHHAHVEASLIPAGKKRGKKTVRTMKFNNNCLPSQKGPSDLDQCNALALVALSCFCQTLAHTMKSLVKKREIVFGL